MLEKIHQQAECSQEFERLEPLQKPLNCCVTTCQEMREMLEICTSHFKEGRDSVWDWLSMRYHEKSFEDMKKRLASYKATLSITFESISIQDHSTTHDSLKELKNSISGTKEDLEDQLDQVRQTINNADTSLREILQADQARLQSSLDSLVQAQQVTATTDPKVIVEGNEAGSGGHAIFGTDTSQPQFSLTVSGNKAGLGGSVVAAGVHSPETLQALLGDSRTPNLALALKALQTQPQSTNANTLQFILKNISTDCKQEPIDAPLETNLRPSLETSEHANTRGIVQQQAQSIESVYESIGIEGELLDDDESTDIPIERPCS